MGRAEVRVEALIRLRSGDHPGRAQLGPLGKCFIEAGDLLMDHRHIVLRRAGCGLAFFDFARPAIFFNTGCGFEKKVASAGGGPR